MLQGHTCNTFTQVISSRQLLHRYTSVAYCTHVELWPFWLPSTVRDAVRLPENRTPSRPVVTSSIDPQATSNLRMGRTEEASCRRSSSGTYAAEPKHDVQREWVRTSFEKSRWCHCLAERFWNVRRDIWKYFRAHPN